MSSAGRSVWSKSGSQQLALREKLNKVGGREEASRWQFKAAVNKEKSDSGLYLTAGKAKVVSPIPRRGPTKQRLWRSLLSSHYITAACLPLCKTAGTGNHFDHGENAVFEKPTNVDRGEIIFTR